MFIRLIAAVLVAWVFAVATPVSAQDASEPSARQLELAGRYVELTVLGDLSKTIELLVEQGISQTAELEGAPGDFMREQAPRLLETAMSRAFDRIVPLYARTFSEAELEALVAFYESPLGASIAEKTIGIAMEEQSIMEVQMVWFLAELMTKYCQEFPCAAGPDLSQMGK